MSETAREEYTRYPKTVAIMRELGITVELVAENEFAITGYWELVLDKDGNRQANDDGSLMVVRHEWPSPADALRVVEAFTQEWAAQKR